MGWPALVGLAISAAGTGMQMAASSQEQRRMEDATLAELGRQRQFQGQSRTAFDQSLKQSGAAPAKQQIDAGTSRLAGLIQQTQAVPLGTNTPTLPKSMTVSGDRANQLSIGRSNTAAAAMGGLSDWQLNQIINDIRTRQQMGIISQNAQISQGVLPLELQAAGQSAEGLRAAGSLASSVGGVAGMYGAMMQPRGTGFIPPRTAAAPTAWSPIRATGGM